MVKIIRLMLLLAFVVAVVAAPAALAQGQTDAPPRRGFAGTVVTYEEGAKLVVEVDRPIGTGNVEFAVTSDTTVTGEVAEGERVVVLAERADGVWTAIYIVAAEVTNPIRVHVGAVLSVDDGTLTIALPDGSTMTIDVPEGVDPPPVGQMVSLFARTRAGAGPDSTPAMTGWQSADQIRERLRLHLQQLADNEDLPPSAQRNRDRLIEQTAHRLEQHARLHVEQMQRVCDHACDNPDFPEQARDRIRQHLQDAQQQRQQAMDHAQDARNRRGGAGAGGPGAGNR